MSLPPPPTVPRPTTLDEVRAIDSRPLSDWQLPRTIHELLQRSGERFGDAPALHSLPSGRGWERPLTLSHGDLLARVRQAANLLTEVGLRPGEAVSMLLPNLPQTYLTMWGAQACGVVNPINPLLTAEHVADIAASADARVLVAPGPALDRGLWDKALAAARRLPHLRALLTVGGPPEDGTPTGVPALHLDALLDGQPADRLTAGVERRPEDVAAYFHTGGTTGRPKLAAQTHANQVYMTWALAVATGMTPGDVILGGLPLFHVNAVHVTGLMPVFAGASVVSVGPLGFRDKDVYANFWRIVERYRVTSFSAVPTVYATLAQVPVDADISSLSFGIVGAAPLPPEVRRSFESRTGVPMCEGYGLTEGTCASVFTPRDRSRPGAVGLPLPYQRIRIVGTGDTGQPAVDCAPGEVGTVMIAGPNVFPGYLRSTPEGPVPDPTGRVLDGWLDTGDLGRLDEDGFLWLTGRAKDLIIRGGHNIDPKVIEDALLAHPDVGAAAAVGGPDPRSGEVPIAFVVVRPGSACSAEELREHAARTVPEAPAAPREVVVVDELPLTAVGKVFKPALRNEAIRRTVLEEMATHGVEGTVTVAVEDGVELATVEPTGACVDMAALRVALGRYSFRHRLVEADPRSAASR